MKLRAFKPVVAICVTLAIAGTSFAQDTVNAVEPVAPVALVASPGAAPLISVKPLAMTVNVNTAKLNAKLHKLKTEVKNISVNANVQLNDLVANINMAAPQVNLAFKDGDEVNYTDEPQDGNELVKNYSKTYSVDGNDKLVIENRYGQVTVNTWARNEIKVDVQIKAGAGNNSDAQSVMDNVSISDSKDGNTVSFKTNINSVKSSWLSIFKGNNGNHHMEINYTVYMPAKNELVIDNRYGGIVIPDMDGKVTINSAYGSFTAGKLTNESAIRVKYGNASIESVGTSAIEVGYGSLNLGSATRLDANISYSGIKLGKLRESANINIRYGDGVEIKDLDRGVKNLAIDASYTNVNIGLSGDENASFAVTTHYGDFNYNDHNVTITAKNPDDNAKGPHFTRSYKGYLGKGGNDGKNIAINTSYGNVKFE